MTAFSQISHTGDIRQKNTVTPKVTAIMNRYAPATIASISTLPQARATAKEIMTSYGVKIPLAGKGRTVAAIVSDCLLSLPLEGQYSEVSCDACNYQACELPEKAVSYEPLAIRSDEPYYPSVASTADTILESITKDVKGLVKQAIATATACISNAIAFTQGFCSVMFGGKKVKHIYS